MDGPRRSSEHKCLLDTTHVYTAAKCVISYQLVFGLLVSTIAHPFMLWLAILTTGVCAAAFIALYRRNSSLLQPLYIYLHFTLLLLLFLGGFVFFANIFFSEKDPERTQGCSFCGLLCDAPSAACIFHMDTTSFAIILHVLNVLLLLFHMWNISIISACRKFLDHQLRMTLITEF